MVTAQVGTFVPGKRSKVKVRAPRPGACPGPGTRCFRGHPGRSHPSVPHDPLSGRGCRLAVRLSQVRWHMQYRLAAHRARVFLPEL